MVNFQMEPMGLLLLVLLCYATKVGYSGSIDCYKVKDQKAATTKTLIDSIIDTTDVLRLAPKSLERIPAADNKCPGDSRTAKVDEHCSIVYQKKGREILKFGCKGCGAANTKFNSTKENCDTCNTTGCNTYLASPGLSAYQTAHGKYKKCIFAEGEKPDLNNTEEIYCTGGDTCQRSEYYDDKKLKLYVGCKSECAAAVKGKNGIDGKNATCAVCSLDAKDNDTYCKKAQTVVSTEQPKNTDRAVVPAAALVLASASAIKFCFALL